MKDIIIPGKVIRKELVILMVSMVAAVLLNVFSIIKYKTAWAELFSQLHVVFAVGIVIYLLVVIFRLVYGLFLKIFSRK